MASLRSPARTPSPLSGPQPQTLKHVTVRHPGYLDLANTLLTLAPTDTVTSVDRRTISGVQYYTVHTACALIAANRFDGWIASDRAGSRVNLQEHEILEGGEYWFHVAAPTTTNSHPITDSTSNSPLAVELVEERQDASSPAAAPRATISLAQVYQYPVMANFRAWRLPEPLPRHFIDCLPESLYSPPGTLPYSAAVRQRDGSCRMTAAVDALQLAHLIPSGEREWFGRNNMAQYALSSDGQNSVDSQFNMLLLRGDVHTVYDNRSFSLIPKADRKRDWSLTAHVHRAHPPSIVKDYHNKRLRPLRGVVPEFLLSRFAYDIFPQVRSFLQGGASRYLVVSAEDGSVKAQWISGDACRQLCEGQGRGRSASPPKRKREDGQQASLAEAVQHVGMRAISSDSGVSRVDSSIVDHRGERSLAFDEEYGVGETYGSEDELESEAADELQAQVCRRKHQQRMWEEDLGFDTPEETRGRKRRRRGSWDLADHLPCVSGSRSLTGAL